VRFTAAGKLPSWQPQVVPAVYAITYKQDASNRPKAHTVVYFGHTDDLSKQAPAINEHVTRWWSERGGDAGDLFVFFHPMPESSHFERTSLQQRLVAEYDPAAN
jgi:hypothetical protein